MSSMMLQDPQALRNAGTADLAATWTDTRTRLLRLWSAHGAAASAMKHPRRRSRYSAERNDICAGFGSCAG